MLCHGKRNRRAFSLLELLVVVAIMVLALAAFASILGSRSVGPAMARAATSINSMVAGVRQNASVRKVHSEIVLDYKRDRVVALSRRRLASFAMESDEGSGGTLARRAGGARLIEQRTLNLRDGKCLELPTPGTTFTIPWAPGFDTSSDYEGIALAFDYCPLENTDASGMPAPMQGGLVSMGGVFNISVSAARPDSVQLLLSCGGVPVYGSTWLANFRWHRVEIAVSRYGVSMWLDGRLDEGLLPGDDFELMPALGQDLRLGGTPCRIDNLELFSLVSSQTYQLDGCQFIVPDTDPMKEALFQAENIFIDRTTPKHKGPVTGPGADDVPLMGAGAGLPNEPVPAIRHVHFDTSGKLDAARHAGAVYVHLVTLDGDVVRRMVLTFHPLGTLTWEEVELFPWEQPQSG